MLSTAQNEIALDGSVDDTEDDFQRGFEELDNNSHSTNQQKLADFLILLQNPRLDDAAIKIKEQCIYRLVSLYLQDRKFDEVLDLLKMNNELFGAIPKAKTAKIVRNILGLVGEVPQSAKIQIKLCEDVVEWCKIEKRTFLRQRIEAKLAVLLLKEKQSTRALQIVEDLLKELKKLDDKQMLTEAHLTEARIYHSLQNIPKSKASLTASRTAANAIYVTPLLQAEIDEMAGMLHCEESDYTTAYSYFLEAFDAYDQSNQKSSAIDCLKYMILCKVLNNSSHEVSAIVTGKVAMKYSGPDVDAMTAITKAAKSHSLQAFKATTLEYEAYLNSDNLISHHLDLLYDRMLESNLLKIIHPYSCVEISHVAKMIDLNENQVVYKLSQMILDHKFSGILDQGKGHLIIYDTTTEDKSFSKAFEIVGNLNTAVETLYNRAKATGRSVM